MKLACPHCRKSLNVPDDYAGKKGKCPACGQTVAVPALPATTPEEETPMRNDSLDTDATNPSPASETASDAGPSPQAARIKPAVLAGAAALVVIVAAAVFLAGGLFGPAKLPVVSLYNTDPEIYKKRHNALPAEAVANWQKALATATGEYITERHVSFALPNLNDLWKADGSLDAAISENYLARLQALPSQALIDWRDPLRQASGGAVSPRLADTALRLVEIERLFNGKDFAAQASQQLVARLKALAPDQVAQWAGALGVERGQAALVLVLMDDLFENETLKEKEFAKQVSRRR